MNMVTVARVCLTGDVVDIPGATQLQANVRTVENSQVQTGGKSVWTRTVELQ